MPQPAVSPAVSPAIFRLLSTTFSPSPSLHHLQETCRHRRGLHAAARGQGEYDTATGGGDGPGDGAARLLGASVQGEKQPINTS